MFAALIMFTPVSRRNASRMSPAFAPALPAQVHFTARWTAPHVIRLKLACEKPASRMIDERSSAP
jgi:hypothetical protein